MPPSEKSNPFADWVIVCDGVRTWIGKEVEPDIEPVRLGEGHLLPIEDSADVTLAPFYEILMRSEAPTPDNPQGAVGLVCLPPMLCTGELVLEVSPTSTIECRGFSKADQAQWAGRIAEAERLRAGKAGTG